MPAPTYLISKVADPVFAVFIGMSAAVMRINREEKEAGRSTKETINSGFRYFYPEMASAYHYIAGSNIFYRRIGFPRPDDPLATKA
jgi:hypothetical protein